MAIGDSSGGKDEPEGATSGRDNKDMIGEDVHHVTCVSGVDRPRLQCPIRIC